MKQRFTMKIAHRYVERACKNFYASEAPDFQKSALKDVKPFVHIHFSDRLITTWGVAYLMDMHDEKVWSMPVDTDALYLPYYGTYHHVIMELNRRVMQWAKPQDVFDTVAHELAHCLDFYLRGKSYHDKYWRAMCINMGASGSTHSNVDIPKFVFEHDIFKMPQLRKGYHDVY